MNAQSVTIGPIANFLLKARAAGMLPAVALKEALAHLHLAGVTQITPDIRAQLAAGLQRSVSKGTLGSLGITARQVYGTGSAGATAGGVAISTGAASALGIGSSIAIGQTAIPIPVVGAAICAVVGAIAILSQRHVGKAEAAWRNPAFYNSLYHTNGRDYDEHSFSEAFKGMLDTGNNIVPGCGPDRHKNPDCLLGPMAGVIAQGYLNRTVPLTATTQQVYDAVVKPWLQSSAGGLVNWGVLNTEPIQQLMMKAAADRYLAGQAMTRGDMPTYSNQGAHTPTLLQVLQPMLTAMTTPAPVAAAPPIPIASPYVAPPPVPIAAPQAPVPAVVQKAEVSLPSQPLPAPAVPVAAPSQAAVATQAAATLVAPGAPAITTAQAVPQYIPSYAPAPVDSSSLMSQSAPLPAPVAASSSFDFSQYLLPGGIVAAGLLIYLSRGSKK